MMMGQVVMIRQVMTLRRRCVRPVNSNDLTVHHVDQVRVRDTKERGVIEAEKHMRDMNMCYCVNVWYHCAC